MILGIDASNIRAGGTVTHLIELLRVADPPAHGFSKVFLWAGSAVLGMLDDQPWLNKSPDPLLEQSADPFKDRRHLLRAYWQRFRLAKLAQRANCNLLFVPGGFDASGFQPMVALSQNMLPFDRNEANRYGISLEAARLWMLRIGQSRTFRRAAGVIFLTRYAMHAVQREVRAEIANTAVIPHGIGAQFFASPRLPRSLEECSEQNPFRVLYISTVDLYKHQWVVAEAVSVLRRRGLPVSLDIVGPARNPAAKCLREALARFDPAAEFIQYLGPVTYEQQPTFYRSADLCVFASTCENLPIILLEGMASGLPIACSDRGPMPEVLGDAGVYFDPEKSGSIAAAIYQLIASPKLRMEKAQMAYKRAQLYSWVRCAEETFSFLAKNARLSQ